MLKTIFLTLLFSIIGFIVFLFIGVLGAGEIWPDTPYETVLPYLLLLGAAGSLITAFVGRKLILKANTNKA